MSREDAVNAAAATTCWARHAQRWPDGGAYVCDECESWARRVLDAAAPYLTADLEAENRELREGLVHNLAREEEERSELIDRYESLNESRLATMKAAVANAERERDEALAEVERMQKLLALAETQSLGGDT